ncbi:MAG: hypothetical protein HYZ29_01445 [Myxococcales bacterium]|nr:hypothetical protein [Myxococcales bacterium]
MVRYLAWAVLATGLACSSSTTNEGPSGTGGGGTGGGGAGGSGGSSTGGGGTGGAVLQCPWGECLKAIDASPCKALAVKCLNPTDCKAIADYATCACSETPGCSYPSDMDSAALVGCIAQDPALAPLCLGMPKCIPAGKDCMTSQIVCCPGLVCMGGTCKPG